MGKTNQKLTSVQIDEDLLQAFRVDCAKDRFSFQKLASRAMYLYLTDKEFRQRIKDQINTKLED